MLDSLRHTEKYVGLTAQQLERRNKQIEKESPKTVAPKRRKQSIKLNTSADINDAQPKKFTA